jgi:hypothetical protein
MNSRHSLLLLLLLVSFCTASAQTPSPNRKPRFFGAPPVDCIAQGESYNYTIGVVDSNLASVATGVEQLTFTVVEPSGFIVSPSSVTGPQSTDSVTLFISATAVNAPVGNLWIKLAVRDAGGRSDTMRYYIAVSRRPAFIMPVVISVYDPDRDATLSQTLYLGIDTTGDATTGFEYPRFGQVDTFYCERELPPLPPEPIFDARWSIITKNGLHRSIHPAPASTGDTLFPWTAVIQLGRTENNRRIERPTISWSRDDAARMNVRLRFIDAGKNFFSLDMASGELVEEEPTLIVERSDDSIRAHLPDFTSGGFRILGTPIVTGVEQEKRNAIAEDIISFHADPSMTGGTIRYRVEHISHVSLRITDLHGRTVRTLFDGAKGPGEHLIQWDGTGDDNIGVASGTYFCLLDIDGKVVTARMVVAR